MAPGQTFDNPYLYPNLSKTYVGEPNQTGLGGAWLLGDFGFSSYQRLGERSGQGEEEGHKPPAPVNGRVHHVAGVHRVGRHPVWRETAVQLVAEQDVAQLGAVVGQHGPVLLPRGRQPRQIHLTARV